MYHFLDRVLECEPGRRVVALKALSLNEEYFRDHFPGMPVVPGAMILEGLVQSARFCLAQVPESAGGGASDSTKGRTWALLKVKGMRFNRFAVPGEVLRLEAERDDKAEVGEDGAIWFLGRAGVDGESVGRLRFALVQIDALKA